MRVARVRNKHCKAGGAFSKARKVATRREEDLSMEIVAVVKPKWMLRVKRMVQMEGSDKLANGGRTTSKAVRVCQ